MRSLLVLALIGCGHNRISAGPNVGVRHGATAGAEITGEVASGGEGPGVVAAATGRLGHDSPGIALRIGGELVDAPKPWGGRVTMTAGPLFTGKNSADRDTRFEARVSAAGLYGFIKNDYEGKPDEDRRHVLGVEVFASFIGADSDSNLVLGIGLTFGAWDGHVSSIASVAPPPREY